MFFTDKPKNIKNYFVFKKVSFKQYLHILKVLPAKKPSPKLFLDKCLCLQRKTKELLTKLLLNKRLLTKTFFLGTAIKIIYYFTKNIIKKRETGVEPIP